MTMPIDLVLVRHGESEGNVAMSLSRKGDNGCFTEEFRRRHSSLWRLTDKGREQAKEAGVWLRTNFSGPPYFDRYYTSEYVRAMETSGLLNLPGAEWFPEFYLRERDWGQLDVCPHDERQERFGEILSHKDQEPLLWAPPDGVPLADVCLRIDRVLDTLHRECRDKRVIIVCHGEVMWGFRVRLERISRELYNRLDASKEQKDKIHNCQVLHYTRRDPVTSEVMPYLNWVRSVCPWDLSLCDPSWSRFSRLRYSNQELLDRVAQYPQLVF